MNSIKIISILALLMLSIECFASDKYIFVVDTSGSMSGTSIENSKASMLKLALSLYKDQSKKPEIALVGSNTAESCGDTPTLVTQFYSKYSELEKEIKALKTNNSDIIPNGYRYAQELLEQQKASAKSKIFMFGDGDGLGQCGGFKAINTNLTNNSKPVYNFSYVGTGWSPEEKAKFSNQFTKMKQKAFDFNELLNPVKDETIKAGFKNAKFLDAAGKEVPKSATDDIACIDNGDVVWEVKALDSTSPHYIRRTFIKSSENSPDSSAQCKKNCSLNHYIALLNNKAYCGITEWRLPDIHQLRLLKSLPSSQRSKLFKTLRKWPHISGTKGTFKNMGQIKGINFEDDNEYDFLDTKPYSAIMVGLKGLGSQINIPSELIESKPVTIPSPKNTVVVNQGTTEAVLDKDITSTSINKPNFQPITGKTVQINGKSIPVPDFQVSKFEVTVSLFQQFIDSTKYQPVSSCEDHNENFDRSWDDPEYSLNKNAPVTCINSKDSQEFIEWFNKENNLNVRLPKLSEWLVFAQEEISSKGDCGKDNLLDKGTANRLNIQKSYQCTDPYFEPSIASSFTANKLGLYNVRGNVSELILLCEKASNCTQYGVIGESWRNKNDNLKLSSAFQNPQNDIGFRLILE